MRFKIPLLITIFVLIILVGFWHFHVYQDSEHPAGGPGLEHSSGQSGISQRFKVDQPVRQKPHLKSHQTSQPVSPIQNNAQGHNLSGPADISDGKLNSALVSKGMATVIQLGHSDAVSSVTFSPDGKYALSGSEDHTLKLWDVSSGREIRSFEGHSDDVKSVAFSPDGKYALSGSGNGTLKLWEISSGREIRSFRGHSFGAVYSVAFSPDGKYALSGSRETIKLWEISSGREIRSFDWYGGGSVLLIGFESVAFSPDGKYVLSGSGNGTLKLWDISSGREIRSFKGHSGHFANVYSVAFSPDGKYALSGSGDKTLRLWEISSGREIRSFKGHSKQVYSVAFSPDGKYTLSGSWDRTLKLWEISSGREIRSFKGHSTKWDYADVASVAFSPDGKYALSGSRDIIKLWEISSGREIRSFKGHSFSVSSVTFSPDGKYALSGSRDIIKLWEISSGREIRSFKGHSGFFDVQSVAFSPDGKYALSGGGDETLKLWDISSGREIRSFKGHSSFVNSVAFSSDGKYALSGGGDKTLRLWEISSGREVRSFKGHSGSVNSVAFSSDGRHALSGGGDKTLRLWDISSGREIRSFKGHSSFVNSVAFSSDGKYALSGSDDKTLKLWDISSGREIRSFEGHGGVESVAFSPDGKYALSGGKDNILKLWDIETGSLLAQMVSSVNGEWIISTPDGYYNNSPEGTHLIHMVPSVGTETYLFDQFESFFKRPDIIKARLSGDLNAGKPAPEMSKPPIIEIQDHMAIKETDSRTYLLKLNTSAPKEVKTVRVFVNGRPIIEAPVNAKAKELSLDIPLFSGANRITAIAYDEKGFSSNPGYLDVICKHTAPTKPNLYVLAIGIGNYPRLFSGDQLDFAHTDARALVKTFQNQEGKLYGQIQFNLLTNKDANLNAIEEALDALSGLKKDDVAVIFLAGHGVKAKDGTFYFLTPAGSFEEPEKGGLSWSVLNKYLSRIKGRVIIFLDACRSGSIVTETIVPNDELAQQFFSGGQGGVMVFSASKGRQSSLESEEIGGGFGVFTYALTQSLGPKSREVDINHNGFVEFTELVDAVSVYVDKKTKGHQTPWLSRKKLFGDLPVAVVSESISDDKRGKLFVKTDPKGSRVRILNIKPKFYQGMEINAGNYHVEVSNTGYKTKKMWVTLETRENKRLETRLERLLASIEPTSISTRRPHEHESTPPKPFSTQPASQSSERPDVLSELERETKYVSALRGEWSSLTEKMQEQRRKGSTARASGDALAKQAKDLARASPHVPAVKYNRHEGTYTYPSGANFVGELSNGIPNGQGTLTYSSGAKYVGQFKNGDYHGHGMLTLRNGTTYVGDFRNGQHNGEGTLMFPSGQKYEGTFKNGKFDGKGCLTFSSGMRHVGDFARGKPEGDGELTFPDGKKYVGGFKSGLMHGQGTLTYPDGKKYVGKFRHNEQCGQGTLTAPDGTEYAGEFKNGKGNGKGTMTYADGTKRVGEFKDGKQCGQGSMEFADGTKYVGKFRNGVPHGQGTFTSPDGDTHIGQFRYGRPVQ